MLTIFGTLCAKVDLSLVLERNTMSDILTMESAPSVEAIEAVLTTRLKGIVPEFELRGQAEIAHEIHVLKRTLNAVILGHNYMEPALFLSVPDYTGDSLELSRVSAETDADVIVFCGVQFMAETAKILSPEKTVLIPSDKAGCSLAAGITAQNVRDLKKRFPGVPVVTYVNTYADVKAETDYCCTSGNADKVLQHLLDLGHDRIIFLPDEYLGRNAARDLKMPFIDPTVHAEDAPLPDRCIIGWSARCEVHEQFSVSDVENVRKQFPDVTILAHPECSPEVIEVVDVSGSTKQMIDYVENNDSNQLLLLTECSMGDNIAAEFPQKEILRLCSVRCPYMNQITLQDTLESLQQLRYQVELDEAIIRNARQPIDRMLEIR